MTKKFIWMTDGTYKDERNGDKYNVKTLGNLIREGESIEVKDNVLGIDYTKETLVKIAFQDALHHNIKYDTDFTIVEMISEVVEEERLYEIIENGNMEQYIIKKRRRVIK